VERAFARYDSFPRSCTWLGQGGTNPGKEMRSNQAQVGPLIANFLESGKTPFWGLSFARPRLFC